jgi:hypothetical protein
MPFMPEFKFGTNTFQTLDKLRTTPWSEVARVEEC